MGRIYQDDGSWVDPDTGQVSGSAPGMLLQDYGLVDRERATGADNYAPGATSFLDVLRTGIGHWTNYKIAALKPSPDSTRLQTSGQPTLADVQRQQDGQLLRLGLIAAAVFFAVRALTARG